MPKKRSPRFEVAGPARRDIAAILKRSIREFGEAASVRYRALIRQALTDIEADPERPGSKERPEIMIKGATHLSPAIADGVIEVARVLDEARDLMRHLPESYRV